MSRHTTWALFASSCTLLTLACYAPTTHAGGWGVFSKPTTDVDRLATQIDKLERHLEEYGSVVPKTPDVWGEARLTKYRKVVERVLATQEEEFDASINGAISRSDQAFLASTLALQAAVSGSRAYFRPFAPPATTPVTPTAPPASAPSTKSRTENVTTTITPTFNAVIGTGNAGTPASPPPSSGGPSGPTPIDIPDAPDLDAPEADFQKIERNSSTFYEESGAHISLEPTIELNQLHRYLQHLNQLRRINDGDDTSDSPGYALHLVRVPVSILPGRKTEEGYGAEITITAKPQLHDKLLSVTFRQLVINDLVDQLTFPLTKFLDSHDGQKHLNAVNSLIKNIKDLEKEIADLESGIKIGAQLLTEAATKSGLQNNKTEISTELLQKLALPRINSGDSIYIYKTMISNHKISSNPDPLTYDLLASLDKKRDAKSSKSDELERKKKDLEDRKSDLENLAGQSTAMVSLAPFRRSTLPFPQSRLLDIYGTKELHFLATLANRLKEDELHHQQLNLLDVSKLMSEELQAAYQFLSEQPEFWTHCNDTLAHAIRANDLTTIEESRANFRTSVEVFLQNDRASQSVLLPLAWAIIVEAALLNERLIEDMNEIATAKDCQCLNGGWLPYFLPNPPPEAVHNFNEYVRCRWPIHVFAVDPITEDQNIADSFSQRREMQLALSMAFASGRINAQKFLRYARQTSLDVDTIALNRTVVGFSHGDDTFGWRFYPRVQTPKTPGNATVVFRDMLYGGLTQDQLLCQRRLEPGQRECTALVIMPSFVPYCTFDMRSNWFKLANPQKKELDLRDGVGISRDIVELRQASATCVKQAHLYRAEDLNHLNRAVDQLESRLPLQTSYVQIPYENSLGGFEFFNTGVTDLAPELKGFYGEPGIDTTKDTTIFVVGDHFSIHETQVIAGNQGSPLTGNDAVPATDVRFELLSRQIMRVTIPANTHTYTTKDAAGKPLELVDLHVATPYGVSNHLSIPVIKSSAQTQAKAAADAAKAEVAKALVASGISYKWKQDDPINATYCTNNSSLSIDFSNSDIDPTSTRQIISNSPQSSIFDPTPEPQLAVIVTGLDADGKAIPGQQWTYTPDFVHDSAAQSGPIAFELSVSVPGAPGSPLTLTLPTRKILQNIQASLVGSVLTPQAPAALQLQGYLRFGGDGAPIMALTNNLLIKLSPINCAPPCIPGTTSSLNSLFTPVATSPPQPSLPLANTPQPKPTLADRYRTPQQATITPPLIAQ
ncbi:hypothetical protein [Lacunimicrobium album]